MHNMFSGANALVTLNVSGWDTSNVTTMNAMFYNAIALAALDVSDWDTGNVTNMAHMFRNAAALTTLDVSNWDTSSVTSMITMFYVAYDTNLPVADRLISSLTTLDVSNWDTSNVTSMNRMFSGARNLTALDVSGWNTSNVTDMNRLFDGLTEIVTLDVSNWNTSRVTSLTGMFRNAHQLTNLDVSGWDTSNVTYMNVMFQNAGALTGLDVSGWETGNVTAMSNMFFGASSLTSLDVSGWDTSRVTNMAGMFRDTSQLSSLDVSGWDTARVTNMATMFSGASALTTLDVSGWDTSQVTSMDRMFTSASALTTLDVSGWVTSNVTDMNSMFRDVQVPVLDVSGWDTGRVTMMASMFRDLNQVTVLDVSGWNTANVTNMSLMFQGVSGVTVLDVSGWNTANVTAMNNMFLGANHLTSLDLSRWDVSRVTTMHSMFRDTTRLTSLDLSGWDTGRAPATAVIMTDIFRGNTNLRRLTLGSGFVHEGLTSPNLPNRNPSGEFTGMWINITPPGGGSAIPSDTLMPAGAGPYAPGIWVWQRHQGIVMISADGTHRFPTVVVGYPQVDALEVAVANAGLIEINVPLTVTLSGDDASDFTLIINDDNLPPGGVIPVGSSWADAFSIRPNCGLLPGTYTATVTVTGPGLNEETFAVIFTVLPDSIEEAIITFTDTVFNGNPQMPAFTVTLHGVVLTEGEHFEVVSWANNTLARNYNDPNPPTLTIRGIGDFETLDSEAVGTFTIRRRPVTLTRGNFNVTKVYDGTVSTVGVTTNGNLVLGNLVAGDAANVRVAWNSISNFSHPDVDDYEVILHGLHLYSFNNDDRHLNYDLGIEILPEIPASITPAVFAPVPVIGRTVATGAVRTISIPISELTPVPTSPMALGSVVSVELHNFTAGPVSATATIADGYLTITTRAEKTPICTEIITVRFDTQNFGNIDVQVNLNTIETPVITIVTQPALSTIVTQGAITATLSVAANVTMGGTTSYQWFMDGVEIPGATGATLPIPNSLTEGTHVFYVVVSSPGAQSVTSNNATVIVVTEATIDFRAIAINPDSDHVFSAAYLGYGSQAAHAVTIANVGTVATGQLTIALSGANPGNFQLSITSIADIVVEGNTSFTVVPIVGLAVGTHTAVVTITGEEIAESFTVSFTVNELPDEPTDEPTEPTVPTDEPTDIPTMPDEPTDTASQSYIQSVPPATSPQQPPIDIPYTTPPADIIPPPPLEHPPAGSSRELHLAYMFGDTHGNFRPGDNLTRAEAATILARTQLLGFEHGIRRLPSGMATFDAFSDVQPGQWFYYYVAWAYDAGMVQGFDGMFRPNDPVTREEFVAMIVRANLTNRTSDNSLSIYANGASSWARAYVQTAHLHGIIFGDANGNFRPQENITRAETATVMNRILGRIDSIAALYATTIENMYNMRYFPDVAAATWYFPSILAATNDHYTTKYEDEIFY